MIVILRRDDLPPEHRHQPLEALKLDHSGLSADLIKKAELIVFVEGTKVQFLKHFPEIQSKNSFEVLLRYITSISPTTQEVMHLSKKRLRRQKKTE